MKHIRPLAFAAVACAALGLSSPSGASAGTMITPAVSTTANVVSALGGHSGVIQVQKTPGNRKTGPYANTGNNRQNNNRNRQKKRRFYNPGVFLDGGYYGNNRHYNDPYYDDPNYNAPSYKPRRYSCGQIRNMLRQQGYRRIKAHDCTGKVYTFIAFAGHKRYKLRIRSKNASIKTRKRI